MNKLPIITLRNLMIDGVKCIGLQYYPTRVVDILVNSLDGVKYADEYKMRYILNNEANLKAIM